MSETPERIAKVADQMIRDRYDSAYEILFDGESYGFVVAAPRNHDELAEPRQPTAVYVCDADAVDDAEELYRAALRFTDAVDRLFESEEEW